MRTRSNSPRSTAHRDELPRLEHALTYADLAGLAARGRAYATRHPEALATPREAVGEDDLFTFIYTSGTTGPPKGCMISHRNEYAMISVVDELDQMTLEGDVTLLYLPLAHNYGRLLHLSGPYCGYTTAFLPDPLQAAEALPAGAADGVSERAAGLREGAHGRARQVRRGDRAAPEADRLGARVSGARSARSARQASRCRAGWR